MANLRPPTLRGATASSHLIALSLGLLAVACTNKDKDQDGETDTADTVDTTHTDDTNSETGDTSCVDGCDSDTGDTGETGHTDTDTDTGSGLPGPNDLARGALVITELMANPTQCTDPRGEYVEVLYQGQVTADLAGLVLASPNGQAVVLGGPVVVNPGDRIVLYANPRNTNPCYAFPGTPFGYDPVLSFLNQGDQLELRDSTGRVLDEVDFGNLSAIGGVPAGASIELHVPPNVDANDVATNWCVAVDVIDGITTDLGTPGAENTCVPLDDTDTGNTGPLDLMITEVLDYNAPNTLRYVELWNPNDEPVSLDDWDLKIYSNGSSIPTDIALPTGVFVPANDCYLVASDAASATDFQAAFGVAPDLRRSTQTGDGNDAFAIQRNGTTVDQFGVPGTNGTGQSWDYTDRTVYRVPTVNAPRASFLSTEWVGAELRSASPCEREPPLLPTDSAVDETDFVGVIDTSVRGETVDTEVIETAVEPLEIADLAAGDLIITEIMAAPTQCSGSNGEYFEILVNPAIGAPVDLHGLQIQDASGISVTYTGSQLVLPGALVVAWFEPTVGTAHCYGWMAGFGVDYSQLSLDDGGDLIRIKYNAVVFDEVDFRTAAGFTVTPARAMQLDGRRYSATQNNQSANWCDADMRLDPLSPDYGTPRQDNGFCDTLGDTDDTDIPVLLAADLNPGDLVITEVMGTTTGTCADADGEYVEVYNNTGARVRLNGVKLTFGLASTTLSTSVELAPGGLAVLARSPATVSCFSYPGAQVVNYPSSFAIDDAGVRIAVEVGSTTIDAVPFNQFTPPFTAGSAWTLNAATLDATSNNLQTNWCFTGSSIGGGGNSGSPGSTAVCP